MDKTTMPSDMPEQPQRVFMQRDSVLRTIADGMDIALFIVGNDGMLLYANPAAAGLTGYAVSELLEMRLWDIVHPCDETRMRKHISSLVSEKILRSEIDIQIRTKNESRLYVHKQIHLIPNTGGEAGNLLLICRDLSERRRIEAQLTRSEERYHTIFRQSLVSIWEEDVSALQIEIERLRNQGIRDFRVYIARNPSFVTRALKMIRVVDVNDITLDLYGASSKEELLLNLDRLMPPENQEIIEREIVALAEGRATLEGECVGLTLDGRRLDLLVRIALPTPADPHKMLVHIIDITEQKYARQVLTDLNRELEERVAERTADLEENRSRFQHLVEGLDDVIFSVDPAGHITYASPAIETLLGVSAPAVLDTGVGRYLLPEERVKALRFLHKVRDSSEYETEFRLVTAGGSIRLVRVSLRPFMRSGKIVGYQGIMSDVTRSKAIQEQLIRSERLAAAGELAASVAHEVNSPLQGITTLIDHLMGRYAADQDLTADLLAVKEGLSSITDTVRRLLDLTRPEGDQRAHIDMNEVIRGTISLMSSYVRKKRIQVIQDLSEDLPRVTASAQRLSQVIINLINNAVEAMTEKNGVSSPIPHSRGMITISTYTEDSSVFLVVADSGSGIKEKSLRRVFEPFYTTKQGRGMGVGLSVSRRIIEGYGGTIWGSNLPEGGAVFTIMIPSRDTRY